MNEDEKDALYKERRITEDEFEKVTVSCKPAEFVWNEEEKCWIPKIPHLYGYSDE